VLSVVLAGGLLVLVADKFDSTRSWRFCPKTKLLADAATPPELNKQVHYNPVMWVFRQLYLSMESAFVPLLNDEPRGTNLTTAGVLAFSAASVESSFFASSSFELFGTNT
jgi:hypothetical protein